MKSASRVLRHAATVLLAAARAVRLLGRPRQKVALAAGAAAVLAKGVLLAALA